MSKLIDEIHQMLASGPQIHPDSKAYKEPEPPKNCQYLEEEMGKIIVGE